jgi:hypothetical protein
MKESFAEKLLDLAINPTNVMEPPKLVLMTNNQKDFPAVIPEEIAILPTSAMEPPKHAKTSTPKPPTSPNADRTTITADLLTLTPQPFLQMPASLLEETTTASLVLMDQKFPLEPLLRSPNNHILDA